MYEYDKAMMNAEAIDVLAGVDEAGRGPLAGPVVAAAVILPNTREIYGLNDSKKLSEKKREAIYIEIISSANVGLGLVDEKTIDELNIYQATILAMRQAVENLSKKPALVLVDGNMKLDLGVKSISIIKGDTKSASIAAASIVAKVTRDRLMLQLHKKYPEYGFAKHKGYPTKEHIEAIKKYGITPIHRKSFTPVSKVLNGEA